MPIRRYTPNASRQRRPLLIHSVDRLQIREGESASNWEQPPCKAWSCKLNWRSGWPVHTIFSSVIHGATATPTTNWRNSSIQDPTFPSKTTRCQKMIRFIPTAPNKQLYDAIKNKIQLTHVVVIMAGVYASYSKWINKEIKIAQGAFVTATPILAVTPWGAERTSTIVNDAADLIVGWNSESIVKGIRQLV